MKNELETLLLKEGIQGIYKKMENEKVKWFIYGMGLMGGICLMIYYK